MSGIDYPPGMNTAPSEPGPREVMWTRRRDIFKRASFVAVALLLLASVGTSTVGVVLIRHQQVANIGTLQSAKAAARDAATTARSVESCTTPGESCYQRSQRNTGHAVASINKVVILAAACASQHRGESVAEIQACVIDRLARHH